jgi:putative transposase
MYRAFTVLLQPTVRQAGLLERLLAAQRELYNAALEERRGAWSWERRRVTKYAQYRQLTELRELRPELFSFGLTVCRGTLSRLDEAFAGFFRRLGAAGRPGYPRFKANARWDSVSWPDVQCWRLDKTQGSGRARLYLQGVGQLRAVGSKRRPTGTPKTLTVRRRGRRWQATVFIEIGRPHPLPMTGRTAGLDLGVANLVATADSDGARELLAGPRPRKALAKRLAAAQRDRSARQQGSYRARVATAHIRAIKAKEARIRKDYAHKASRRLVDSYDVICHEGLAIANMVRSARGTKERPGTGVAAKAGLNDAISDAGWGQLIAMISYKAAGAGRPATPPAAVQDVGTQRRRTGSPKPCSDVGAAVIATTPI